MKGPILCFVGPPGVGKTSLGQSIARAMNRKFVRISLGGVRDEAEIRGHRRTYIGSMPGRLVQALKTAGSSNPVLMLDEIDKISVGIQGDPAAALLEVLDPAQNHAFRDHYLEIPIDLSRVLFIATANQLGTIHPALLDRMELISLSGYTEEEKVHIAKHVSGAPPAGRERPEARTDPDHGRRSAARDHGIHPRGWRSHARATDWRRSRGKSPRGWRAMRRTPRASTRARSKPTWARRGSASETAFRTSRPGVATGVAWTEIWRRRALRRSVADAGRQRAADADRPARRRHAGIGARGAEPHPAERDASWAFRSEFLSKQDLHIHVPAGAIPKDGPSAGVTMATAIVSAARGVPIEPDVAMTGEITLSGLVLPVGGIREKALAARRHGIRTFILPS